MQSIINECLGLHVTDSDPAAPQPGTYNPQKLGRAFNFNEFGLKLRNVRKLSIDDDNNVKRNIDHDDLGMDFERCQNCI